MLECPEFMEVENELIGANTVVARVARGTVEALLGRELVDRADFKRWVDEHREALLHAAFLKRVRRPIFAPGEDRTITILPDDLR